MDENPYKSPAVAGVVLKDLSKIYGHSVAACDGINLEIADGEVLVLVGPSGSGKTTTLRLIAGLEQPTLGSIQIGGKLVNGIAARHRNVAMVFQSHAIYPHWTVYKNLAFGLELRELGGWRRLAWPLSLKRFAAQDGERHARVVEAARMLGIEPLLDRPASELSGGEEQRVALGRAIVRRPNVFLFDEPLSNLDAQLRVELRRQLKQLHGQLGATMIYVTHDQMEALALGDRIAVMNRGQVEQVGTPQDLYGQPANRFVAGFIGTPPMNFFQAVSSPNSANGEWRLSKIGWELSVSADYRPGVSPTEAVVVGLRPEDVHIRRSNGEPSKGEDPSTPAIVTLVESQGDSCVVSLMPKNVEKSGNQASPEWPGAVLLGKALVSLGLKPGEQVIAWFDMRRAHWFDGKSGRNLRPPSAE